MPGIGFVGGRLKNIARNFKPTFEIKVPDLNTTKQRPTWSLSWINQKSLVEIVSAEM